LFCGEKTAVITVRVDEKGRMIVSKDMRWLVALLLP
jgi:hypothetical protein